MRARMLPCKEYPLLSATCHLSLSPVPFPAVPVFDCRFTPDGVCDNYPAGRLMHDIVPVLMPVQTRIAEMPCTFPAIPQAA